MKAFPSPDSAGPSPDEQAAAWLARRDAGWTPAEAANFAAWRRADPRHDQAACRLEATESLLGQLPEALGRGDLWEELEALSRPRAPVSRFPMWARGAAAAALVLLGLTIGAITYTHLAPYDARHVTQEASTQPIVLPDQSEVLLGGESVVEIHYTRRERHLHLTAGEGRFTVVKDPDRPFLVAAGNVSVRAVGTIFDVRNRGPNHVEVSVTEGVVSVTPTGSGAGAGQPMLLTAGQSHRWAPSPLAATSPAALPAPTAAPAPIPKLTFNETPLAEAVALFNRHSPVQLELGDADLAQRTVGGVFSADAGEAFASLLGTNGDIVVERAAADRIILRRAP